MGNIFVAAVILELLAAASLFAKAETYRALGRVAGGLAKIALVSWALTMVYRFVPQAELGSYTNGCIVFYAAALVTIASGARKFIRRNSQ